MYKQSSIKNDKSSTLSSWFNEKTAALWWNGTSKAKGVNLNRNLGPLVGDWSNGLALHLLIKIPISKGLKKDVTYLFNIQLEQALHKWYRKCAGVEIAVKGQDSSLS